MTTLHWFRNDLRIRDNEALSQISAQAKSFISLYCINPEWFSDTGYGFPKMGAHRANFLIESIADLRKQLQNIGSDLIIRIGKPETIIPELCEEFQIASVTWQDEIAPEEKNEENALIKILGAKQIKHTVFSGTTLFHPDDLPFPSDNVPDVFTAFRKKVEKYSEVRDEFQISSLPPLPQGLTAGEIPALSDFNLEEAEFDDRSVLQFEGGSSAGWKRIQHYFWETDHLKSYKETRNGLIGADYSSKLSPWLANGSLSPRSIYHEVKRYENERGKNDSTYWLIFELLWRDYFKFIAQKYGARLFYSGGFKSVDSDWSDDPELFSRWQDGQTGIPFIDANMRELAASGFMSNRGRQNVASYFSKYLNLDWRMGAAWFESQLIDYDVCSNWGNWAYVSGVGNDPRDRYFNIISQAQRYDENGEYVRYWIPELDNESVNYIHEPWKNEKRPNNYPSPIIDFEEKLAKLQQK